jgi:hypothetical protein
MKSYISTLSPPNQIAFGEGCELKWHLKIPVEKIVTSPSKKTKHDV